MNQHKPGAASPSGQRWAASTPARAGWNSDPAAVARKQKVFVGGVAALILTCAGGVLLAASPTPPSAAIDANRLARELKANINEGAKKDGSGYRATAAVCRKASGRELTCAVDYDDGDRVEHRMLLGADGSWETEVAGAPPSGAEQNGLSDESTCSEWDQATLEEQEAYAATARARVTAPLDIHQYIDDVQCAGLRPYPSQAKLMTLGTILASLTTPSSTTGRCYSGVDPNDPGSSEPYIPPCD